MAVTTDLTIRQGDSYLSPWWVLVVDGDGVNLADPGSGWTVEAKAGRGGEVVVDFDTTDGARVLTAPWSGTIGGVPVETSAARLYLTPEASAALAAGRSLKFNVELRNPTGGPLGDPYKVTLVDGVATVEADVPL